MPTVHASVRSSLPEQNVCDAMEAVTWLQPGYSQHKLLESLAAESQSRLQVTRCLFGAEMRHGGCTIDGRRTEAGVDGLTLVGAMGALQSLLLLLHRNCHAAGVGILRVAGSQMQDTDKRDGRHCLVAF